MRKEVYKHFVDLSNEIRRYRASVDAAMSRYREDKADAIENLNERKLPVRLEEIQGTARSELYSAYSKLKADWHGCYEKLLRESLIDHVRQTPPEEAMKRLAIYRDYDIPMTKTDVMYFLSELSGTHVGSCALAAVAAKHGITVKVPTVEQLEKDIDALDDEIYKAERYVGREFSSEWKEVHPEIKNIWQGDDPFSPRNMTIAYTDNENMFSHINAIMQRWSASFVPELVYDEEMKEEERAQAEQEHEEALKAAADQIEIDDNADGELGRAHGKQKAESMKNAQEIVQAYASGAPGTGGAR